MAERVGCHRNQCIISRWLLCVFFGDISDCSNGLKSKVKPRLIIDDTDINPNDDGNDEFELHGSFILAKLRKHR
jgi:hypothetical protein